MESAQRRLTSIEDLLPTLTSVQLDELLHEAGAAPCAALLADAVKHMKAKAWSKCHLSALKAREYAWERLHSGPSWQCVAPVHRDAYGLAGILVAVVLFLSAGGGSLDKVFYNLDLVALMTGGFFQRLANCFIERIEHHEDLGTEVKRIKQLPAIQRYRAQISSPIDSVGQEALPHDMELIRATAEHASGRDLMTATSRGQGQGREQRHLESHPPHQNVVECQKSDDRSQEQATGGNKKRDVDRVHFPSLEVFQREFMETSTPVILTGVMEAWPALGQQDRDAGGSRCWADPSYLRRVAGRRTVPVEIGGCYTAEGWRQELMTLADFMARYIEPGQEAQAQAQGKGKGKAEACGTSGGGVGGVDAAASSASNSCQAGKERKRGFGVLDEAADTLSEGGEQPMAYLAQHQLFDQIPALRRDVITPDYCALLLPDEEEEAGSESVMMNAWFGPAGTVSPLHNDPFHNLLAQVVGTKRVKLVDHRLSSRVYPMAGLMRNTSEVDAADPDLLRHPLFQELMPLTECELKRGEVLYIPPLFWHHVTSLEVSFSVSFWWGKRRTLAHESCQLPNKHGGNRAVDGIDAERNLP